MTKNKSNGIRIFWIENDKEKSKMIYPKLDYDKMSWRDSDYWYIQGLTEVCHYFNCNSPDELYQEVKWCYEHVTGNIKPDIKGEEYTKALSSDEYKTWLRLKINSEAVKCSNSMFSDAFKYILMACRLNGSEKDERSPYKDLKSSFDIGWLFNEMLGNQKSYIPHGAWILRDGSYITVETANHARFVEEYLNLSEYDYERYWIKVQMGTVYTHRNMTDAQKKTLNKFFKQYELKEKDIED